MSDLESANPHLEVNVKLCAAVKKYKCLHDQKSCNKNTRPECEEAWEMVAEECNETIEFCKNRWKSLRRCFFNGLKRRGNKYYLHDHLKFLQGGTKKKPKRKAIANFNEETNSIASDSLQKSHQEESEMNGLNIYDEDDAKSNDSRTTSADESHDLIQQANESSVFIINEIEEEAFVANNDEDLLDERRLNFRRSCKRPLDPELIDELTEEEPEDKRSRKSENHSTAAQSYKKPKGTRMDKLKINLKEKTVESVRGKMVHGFTQTDFKQTKNFGTQYELNSMDFDDIFMNSIKTQLNKMNARQKLNFKRKMFQSLVEVFDDGNDFPNGNDTLPLTPRQAPCAVDTTIGELRLMRELVALVQAAKITPEIMNAKDMSPSYTTAQNKSPVKMPLPIVDNSAKAQISPISISPSPEDEDLQYFIDTMDDEGVVPLPKPAEPTRVISDDNVVGLPRRVLQKVVRVSGPSGSTIVTRDGDRKRIYRIFPKVINPNGNHDTKNGNSSGSFLVSSSKNLIQETRKDGGVGTFYVSSTKSPQDTTKLSNTAGNISMRSLNNKPTNQISNSINISSQRTSSNSTTTNSTINNQTIFRNVHPANRILSPTTGYFKMVPTTKTVTPSIIVPSTMGTSGPIAGKVLTAKLPVTPMLPPNSNAATKRVQAVRTGPQIMQRRYSICGPLPAEKPNTPSPSATGATNGNPPAKSSISQIQISQPISLNAKAINAHTSSSSQNFSSNIQSKTTATSTASAKKTSEETVATKDRNNSANSTTTTLKQSNHIPILETAGTVEADDLDPLSVKAPSIKSEPVDE